ncbi:MAG: sulfotransferase domain-containing protein [Crocinitomicaceae bacterium]
MSGKFLILSEPRSGSNMLCSLLNSHPEIVCHHELFNIKGVNYALDWRDTEKAPQITKEERDQHPLVFLDSVWKASPSSFVGFKMTSHPDRTVLYTLLKDTSVKKIILTRKNRLRMYVSFLTALKNNQWEVYKNGENPKGKTSVHVNKEEFVAHAEGYTTHLEHCTQQITENEGDFISIYYEDLKEPETHRMVLDYIGVNDSNHSLETLSIKLNRNRLSDVISNYDELAEALHGTPYQHQLKTLDHEVWNF